MNTDIKPPKSNSGLLTILEDILEITIRHGIIALPLLTIHILTASVLKINYTNVICTLSMILLCSLFSFIAIACIVNMSDPVIRVTLSWWAFIIIGLISGVAIIAFALSFEALLRHLLSAAHTLMGHT